jgi:hypothetical protein
MMFFVKIGTASLPTPAFAPSGLFEGGALAWQPRYAAGSVRS